MAIITLYELQFMEVGLPISSNITTLRNTEGTARIQQPTHVSFNLPLPCLIGKQQRYNIIIRGRENCHECNSLSTTKIIYGIKLKPYPPSPW